MEYFDTHISTRFGNVALPSEYTGSTHKEEFKSPPAVISASSQRSISEVSTLDISPDSDIVKPKAAAHGPPAFPSNLLDESSYESADEYLNYMLYNDTALKEMVENDFFDQRGWYDAISETHLPNPTDCLHPTSFGDDEPRLVSPEKSVSVLPSHLFECEHFGIDLASVYRDHDFSFYPPLDDEEEMCDTESDSDETSSCASYKEGMETDYDADTEDMESDSDETSSCTSYEEGGMETDYDADTEEGVDTEED